MDRLRKFSSPQWLAAGLLATAALSSGCRNLRSEVPPGKPYARTGEQPPAVGFSTEPHPSGAGASPPSMNLGPGGLTDDPLAANGGNPGGPQYGTPTRTGPDTSVPTANKFGPPGTSGLDPSAGAGAAEIANSLMDTGQSVSKSLANDPSLKGASGLTPQ